MTYIRKRHDDALSDDAMGEPTMKTPSWFAQEPLEQSDPSSDSSQTSQPYIETPNAQAYEAYKRRMEQRFSEAQDIYDRTKISSSQVNLKRPQVRRPTMPLQEIQGRKRLYQLEQQEYETPKNAAAFPWSKMIALSTAAVCLGAVAGLGFSNSDLIKQKYQATLGVIQQNIASLSRAEKPAVLPSQTATTHETIIGKKPVATARLDVNDVRGTLGGMIPLALSAQSADSTEPISLKISGLPDQAYLTAGVKSAQGNWTLKPSELSDLKLFVPQSNVNQFDMEVAAVEDSTGALAAPIKSMNVQLQGSAQKIADIPVAQVGDGKVDAELGLTAPAIISPVNAAPETAVIKANEPSAIPAALSEADDLVAKGNALLASGDIVSARQFFLRAAELGNAQGSFGVARTYDPKVFAQLNVVGLQPDPLQAADWYKKAAASGVVAATQ